MGSSGLVASDSAWAHGHSSRSERPESGQVGRMLGARRGHAASQVLRVHEGDSCSFYVIVVIFCPLGRALTATVDSLGCRVITAEVEESSRRHWVLVEM